MVSFLVGVAVGAVGVLLWRRRTVTVPPPDEQEQRRAAQRAREYRNFLTYNGYESEEQL